MSWHKIVYDPADRLFSVYIRLLRGGKCEKCGKLGALDAQDRYIVGLQASHFHSRGKRTVRFAEENVDCLCISCHKFLEEHKKTDYAAWKLDRMGQKAYDKLELAANMTGKKDKVAELMYVKQLMKNLENY